MADEATKQGDPDGVPYGVEFDDKTYGRVSLQPMGGEAWVCRKHVDGQWVSQRLATEEDLATVRKVRFLQSFEPPKPSDRETSSDDWQKIITELGLTLVRRQRENADLRAKVETRDERIDWLKRALNTAADTLARALDKVEQAQREGLEQHAHAVELHEENESLRKLSKPCPKTSKINGDSRERRGR